MAPHKTPVSYRLSPAGRELINRLADHMGLSQAGIIEMAVRKLARAELPPDEHPSEPPPSRRKRTPRAK